mmetsp:Transcript_22973/g.37802  ORF Transcript_22973/g.37802 Transcript_22973/m.37802 type:complete len:995 (+) Transcript_22973:166-3150(+)|eukprot:CAMPEP_0184661518 /NCGR_PEP_ID=MMETSP0308-20130426/38798_1 /TAXON_ID=38269 /ORGANISM="Gloeochaete witrockiana, Strain SAG 46.84" /LENGTH=994 /DNA_ID=CAMNT_0027102877 /DNA_START=145 /DNA_END=3132 /DNA_ORIENTATION=-
MATTLTEPELRETQSPRIVPVHRDLIRSIFKAVCTKSTGFVYGEAWAFSLVTQTERPFLSLTDSHSASGSDRFRAEALQRFRFVNEEIRIHSGEGLIGRVWEGAIPEWVEDISHVPESLHPHRNNARSADLHAAFAVPVVGFAGRPVAVVALYSARASEENFSIIDCVSHAFSEACKKSGVQLRIPSRPPHNINSSAPVFKEYLTRQVRSDEEMGVFSQVCRSFRLFRKLSSFPVNLSRIASFAEYSPSHIVYSHGEVGTAAYVILEGSVQVRAPRRSSLKDRSMWLLKAGDNFGEANLFDPFAQRCATVIVKEHVRLLVLDSKNFTPEERDAVAAQMPPLKERSIQEALPRTPGEQMIMCPAAAATDPLQSLLSPPLLDATSSPALPLSQPFDVRDGPSAIPNPNPCPIPSPGATAQPQPECFNPSDPNNNNNNPPSNTNPLSVMSSSSSSACSSPLGQPSTPLFCSPGPMPMQPLFKDAATRAPTPTPAFASGIATAHTSPSSVPLKDLPLPLTPLMDPALLDKHNSLSHQANAHAHAAAHATPQLMTPVSVCVDKPSGLPVSTAVTPVQPSFPASVYRTSSTCAKPVSAFPYQPIPRLDGEYGEPGTPTTMLTFAAMNATSKEKIVDFQQLSQFFSMPLQQAAKQLGMCATTLKKICRSYGIQRWPNRKIRMVNRSISHLQGMVSGMPATANGQDPSASASASSSASSPQPIIQAHVDVDKEDLPQPQPQPQHISALPTANIPSPPCAVHAHPPTSSSTPSTPSALPVCLPQLLSLPNEASNVAAPNASTPTQLSYECVSKEESTEAALTAAPAAAAATALPEQLLEQYIQPLIPFPANEKVTHARPMPEKNAHVRKKRKLAAAIADINAPLNQKPTAELVQLTEKAPDDPMMITIKATLSQHMVRFRFHSLRSLLDLYLEVYAAFHQLLTANGVQREILLCCQDQTSMWLPLNHDSDWHQCLHLHTAFANRVHVQVVLCDTTTGYILESN